MDNISEIVGQLEVKLQSLLFKFNNLNEEKQVLLDKQHMLKETIEQQKRLIRELEEQNKLIKVAKTISVQHKDPEITRAMINELVREIDKCMALLNE